MSYVFSPPATVSVEVKGRAERFPVNRIYCVGRNYAAHAREMGKDPDREPPFFFTKPANAIVANNVFIENRRHGIWGLGDPDMGNVVMGNVCAHNGEHGLEACRARGNVIAGNLLRNNSQNKAGEFAAVLLENHRDNLVAANLCLDDQAASTQTTGISSQTAAQTNLQVHNPLITTPAPDAH